LQAGNYDKTYYLEPGEGGAKAYALLRRAMEETGRIAIARVVIRSKESLAVIRVFKNGVLAMETMHFPDEVRSPAGLTGIVEPELRPQEMEMATNLIASLSSGEFTPEKFANEYRQAVLDLIAAKAAGEDVTQVEQPVEQGRVVDLMEALRASVRQAEAARGDQAAVPPARGVASPAPVPGIPGGATIAAGAAPTAPPVPGLPGGAPRAPAPAPPLVPGVSPLFHHPGGSSPGPS
jgi:DNA end-binding protein Ku